jgi:acetoin utilization deacetylase AcuC-like enzyme
MYAAQLRLFYRPEMVLEHDTARNYSKSPLKPQLFVDFLRRYDLLKHFVMWSEWPPFRRDDFLVAHTERYVDAFFSGREPLASSNRLAWSEQFADSVRYTNASLYHALRAAVAEPGHIAFSPTSGFHHATPRAGSGFCTFSGQVIASVKLYRRHGLAGAYIDLDGHYGNSIEDSRAFVPELNEAIPRGCNVNPQGKHEAYLADLTDKLRWLRGQLLQKRIHYIVFAHGADSHEWDNLGGQCTTAEWLEASRLVYRMLDETSRTLRKPVPLVLSLFGGYRRDHYDSVLSLHAADAAICLSILCHQEVGYQAEVRRPAQLPMSSSLLQRMYQDGTFGRREVAKLSPPRGGITPDARIVSK